MTVPVKYTPDFLPMREELYGNTDTFPAAITPENLPGQDELSALISNPGYQTARAAFDKLFLPFSQSDLITDSARRNALSAIRIGDAFPFLPSADTNACIAAVMNHLSRRYLEEERSGEAISILQEQQVITFGEAAFPPVERPFWQSMLPYVQKEKAQYQALLKRNETVKTLCAALTADLAKQQKLSRQFLEAGKALDPEPQMTFSDPISVKKHYPELTGTPIADRLKPQVDFYAQPEKNTAVAAWDSVQDGFAIDEHLTAHPSDPRQLTEEQLANICVHPHITNAESAMRLLDVHRINSPRRISLARGERERTVHRESISLTDLNGQIIREGKTNRISQEKERKIDGPNKQN